MKNKLPIMFMIFALIVSLALSNDFFLSAKAEITSINKGDIIIFGSYEQDNDTTNGQEPLEWIVLSVDGVRVLLFSRLIIDCMHFDTDESIYQWEKSELREYLNGEFYDTAFTQKEQACILITKREPTDMNNKVQDRETTSDKVFLLSKDEVESKELFENIELRADCTGYTRIKSNNNTVDDWWTSTSWLSSSKNVTCATKYESKDFFSAGMGTSPTSSYGVRPAINVSLDSLMRCATASRQRQDSISETITFRGLPWYTDYYTADAEIKKVSKKGSIEDYWCLRISQAESYRGGGMTWTNNHIKDGGFECRYEDTSVAGYTSSKTIVCFMYPVNEQGTLDKTNAKAELYLAWYQIVASDSNSNTLNFYDLVDKLEMVYGTPSFFLETYGVGSKVMWTDKDGNIISLYRGSNWLSIAYMANDAEDRLNGITKAIKQAEINKEAEERNKNKDNTSGL